MKHNVLNRGKHVGTDLGFTENQKQNLKRWRHVTDSRVGKDMYIPQCEHDLSDKYCDSILVIGKNCWVHLRAQKDIFVFSA